MTPTTLPSNLSLPSDTLHNPTGALCVSISSQAAKQHPSQSKGNLPWMPNAISAPPLIPRPFFESPRPQAGFPSPADDFLEEQLDLNRWLITNPPATFYAHVEGDSMRDLGILDRDIVAIDRSKKAREGCIVVASFQGGIYIKLLRKLASRWALCSENCERREDYPPMFLEEDQEHTIWGVVIGVVRKI